MPDLCFTPYANPPPLGALGGREQQRVVHGILPTPKGGRVGAGGKTPDLDREH